MRVRLLNNGSFTHDLDNVAFPVIVPIVKVEEGICFVSAKALLAVGAAPEYTDAKEEDFPFFIGTECEILPDTEVVYALKAEYGDLDD